MRIVGLKEEMEKDICKTNSKLIVAVTFQRTQLDQIKLSRHDSDKIQQTG